MEHQQLKNIIQAAIFASEEPLKLERMSLLFEAHEQPSKEDLQTILDELVDGCEGTGLELQKVASGYRYQVISSLAPWVKRLWAEKPPRYSRATLETLAIIAYRQPITRAEIEDIRGVAVSTHIVRVLLDHEWAKVVGHRDTPGKPSLYATTKFFLDSFNLETLAALPSLPEIQDMEQLELKLQEELGEEASTEEQDVAEAEEEQREIADSDEDETTAESEAETERHAAAAVEDMSAVDHDRDSSDEIFSEDLDVLNSMYNEEQLSIEKEPSEDDDADMKMLDVENIDVDAEQESTEHDSAIAADQNDESHDNGFVDELDSEAENEHEHQDDLDNNHKETLDY